MFQGTDLQKYLNDVGHSAFEVSNPKNIEKLCPSEVSLEFVYIIGIYRALTWLKLDTCE